MAGESSKEGILYELLNTLREQGHVFDIDEYRQKIDQYKRNQKQLDRLYKELLKTPIAADYPYIEPSLFEEIVENSDFNLLKKEDKEVTYDKIYGAWLGRVSGCVLGIPCEGFSSNVIKTYLTKANAYPLKDYFPLTSKAIEEDHIHMNRTYCCKGQFESACSDDDIRYSILAYNLVNEKGIHFSTYDVAKSWIMNLPFWSVFTAESQAYLNFINLDRPVHWNIEIKSQKEWDYIANYYNPYNEWIGAQIRIDTYGYIAANHPALAAKMAYRDAYFSHRKNGIYGAMYFAALISLAFSANSIEEAIFEALKVVPKKSRFYEMVLDTVNLAKNIEDEEELIQTIVEKYNFYHRVHTISNAAIIIASLIYGHEDYLKSMFLCVMMGKDTDCNGATIGSILGAFYGAKKSPQTLIDPLHDLCYSSLPDFHPVKISTMAQKTYDLYLKYKDEQ